MVRAWWLGFLLCLLPAVAWAGPGDDLDDRAKILAAEMRRDAALLAPYLSLEPGSRLRRLAIRALGRIGDDGTGPGILRDFLSAPPETDADMDLWLWSAGVARAEELALPLAKEIDRHMEAKRWDLAAEATRALGWTGADKAAEALLPLVWHPHKDLVVAALEGLARVRPKERRFLEEISKGAVSFDPGVRAMADHACWLIAAGYRGAQKAADENWDGDPELCAKFYDHLKSGDTDRILAGLRVLGILLPKTLGAEGDRRFLFDRLDDVEPRVVQELVSRVLAPREGREVELALVKAVRHTDPKVRTLAARALGQKGDAAVPALGMQFLQEEDARVREVLAVELARLGKEFAWNALAKRDDRPADPAVRQATEVGVLLASKRPEALGELLAWADPGASQRVDLHAATWMAILGGLEGKDVEGLDAWLEGFFHTGYAIPPYDRPFVQAAAVSLVGANKRHALAPVLLGMLDPSHAPPHAEVRQALAGALAALAKDDRCPAERVPAMEAWVETLMREDPNAWVRRAARAAARELEIEDVPDIDEEQPNEWRGLPRAQTPAAGVDPAGEGEWLDEKEILQIADWIAAHDPHLVFETTAGSFTLLLHPEVAPVHSVSLFNAVRNGVYDGTRFHRVVPSFVVQGGDPHGHGAGGGGWTVPDEISPLPYVRGALGMPKSAKDDGGCQIFIMHTEYRPLNERYTCYGNVVAGMDAVDRIRVGDRIVRARVVVPPK
jgi:cyclophilin family peptidyl-prolyl cis-trans isomerase